MLETVVDSFQDDVGRFIEHCRERAFSRFTIRGYGSDLVVFGSYLSERGVDFSEVDLEDIDGYGVHLEENCGYKPSTIERKLNSLGSLFKFLKRNALHERARRNRRQHGEYESRYEKVATIDDTIKLHRAISKKEYSQGEIYRYRDRAIVETLFGSGVTSNELLNLEDDDIEIGPPDVIIKVRSKTSYKTRSIKMNPSDQSTGRPSTEWTIEYKRQLKVFKEEQLVTDPHFILNRWNKGLGRECNGTTRNLHRNLGNLVRGVTPNSLRNGHILTLLERNMLSNIEIASRLGFSSSVQVYHIRKYFSKIRLLDD